VPWCDVTRGAQGRAPEPNPALSWCAAQKGGSDLDDFASRGSRPLEQRGQTIDLFQATAGPRDGVRGFDQLREPHLIIVAQL
jgi:hypothetical protein